MPGKRSDLQQEVAEALIASDAINFDIVGSVLSKFAARAALNGTDIGVIIGHHVIDACIPPYVLGAAGRGPVIIETNDIVSRQG